MKAYLSYSREGMAPARRLSDALRQTGVEALDPLMNSGPGQDWSEAIERAVDEADAMVFLVGPHTARETVLQRDWSMALERSWSYPDKPLIPVVLGDVELPAFLRDRQAIRAEPEGDMSAAAAAIVQAMHGRELSFSLARSAFDPAQGQERKQRIEEIAQQADQLTPTPEELQREAQELTSRIAEVERLRPDTPELAELHVKLLQDCAQRSVLLLLSPSGRAAKLKAEWGDVRWRDLVMAATSVALGDAAVVSSLKAARKFSGELAHDGGQGRALAVEPGIEESMVILLFSSPSRVR